VASIEYPTAPEEAAHSTLALAEASAVFGSDVDVTLTLVGLDGAALEGREIEALDSKATVMADARFLKVAFAVIDLSSPKLGTSRRRC
jgi:hypothetical protein